MKGRDSVLLVGVFGLAAYGYYKNTMGLVDSIRVKLNGVKFNKTAWQDSNFFTLFFDFDFSITNPSSGTAVMKSANLNIAINGKNVGTITKLDVLNIYPMSTTKTKIGLRIPTLKAFSVIQNAVEVITLKKPLKIDVTGEIDFTVGKLKINESQVLQW